MNNLWGFIFATISTALLVGCSSGGGGGSACEPAGVCPADGTNIEVCCSDTSCSVSTGTKSFSCVGFDCDDAINALFNFCGPNLPKTELDLTKLYLKEKANKLYLKNSVDQMYIDLGEEISK